MQLIVDSASLVQENFTQLGKFRKTQTSLKKK